MSDLEKLLAARRHASGLPTSTLPSKMTTSTSTKSNPSKRSYSQTSWNAYFDRKIDFPVDSRDLKVNAYASGDSGPLFYLLHGGGYSGLTWACFSHDLCSRLHCQVLAPDLRGHGETTARDESDFSIDMMSNDAIDILHSHYKKQGLDKYPPVIVVGHSMGGAIAVHAAASKAIPNLLGIAMIDVVEGSALDALQGMQTVLLSRPRTFKSIDQAIEWCLRSGQTRNIDSARVSMPGQVCPCEPSGSDVVVQSQNGTIVEEEEESEEAFKAPAVPEKSTVSYRWRIDLSRTEPFWHGWFEGLSKLFLSVPAAKLLILAGTDRLDKDLTIGQMQGKFQMVVLPRVGHAVQEDDPSRLADTLASFATRNKFAESKCDFKPVFPGC